MSRFAIRLHRKVPNENVYNKRLLTSFLFLSIRIKNKTVTGWWTAVSASLGETYDGPRKGGMREILLGLEYKVHHDYDQQETLMKEIGELYAPVVFLDYSW